MPRNGYNALGQEMPDQTPIELPAGYRKPESLQDQIKRLIRVHMSIAADATGRETFEEANDFGPEEEFDDMPLTQYELADLAPEPIAARDADDSSGPADHRADDLVPSANGHDAPGDSGGPASAQTVEPRPAGGAPGARGEARASRG